MASNAHILAYFARKIFFLSPLSPYSMGFLCSVRIAGESHSWGGAPYVRTLTVKQEWCEPTVGGQPVGLECQGVSMGNITQGNSGSCRPWEMMRITCVCPAGKCYAEVSPD